ncbi:hypothetical protein [Methylobacterium sp. J-048]|uniref:nucleotide-binding protein n=1 Tax=Methylobacterium sp. J-048 TaxID=2836635 RepID=UPI00391C0932
MRVAIRTIKQQEITELGCFLAQKSDRVPAVPKLIGPARTNGGIGKTTIAANLAAVMVRRGVRIWIADAAPASHAYAVAEMIALFFPVAPPLLLEGSRS